MSIRHPKLPCPICWNHVVKSFWCSGNERKSENWITGGPYQCFHIYSFCNSQKAWPNWWSLRPGCPLRTSFLIPIRNKTDHICSRLQENPDMGPNRTETHTWCPLCNRNLVSRKLYHRSTLPLLKYNEGIRYFFELIYLKLSV